MSRFKEYVVGHRMASLRTLSFRIIIPNSDAFDSVGVTQRDNSAFTRSIRYLWAILKSIEDRCHMRQALKLRVHLSAQPSHSVRSFRGDPLDFVNDRNLTTTPEDLTPLPWIDGFSVIGTSRGIHSAALTRLASRFQDLTYFKVHLEEKSTQVRSDMAREISNLFLPRLSELVVNFGNNLLPLKSSLSSDAFSVALHGLFQSPNLLKVSLGDVRITPELFWPRLEEFGGRQNPVWPYLQSMTVMISSEWPDGTSLHIHEHLIGEFESARLDMSRVNPLFMAAARAAQYMPKLLKMTLRVEAHKDMDCPLCEMAFAAQGYCSEEDIKGYHAALRLDGFIFLDSRNLVLRPYQLDLSKPRVSVVMPSKCTIDSRLAQVWKISKGEDVDYNVCSGFVRDDDDDEDND